VSKWNFKLDNMNAGKRASYESTNKAMAEHEVKNIV